MHCRARGWRLLPQPGSTAGRSQGRRPATPGRHRAPDRMNAAAVEFGHDARPEHAEQPDERVNGASAPSAPIMLWSSADDQPVTLSSAIANIQSATKLSTPAHSAGSRKRRNWLSAPSADAAPMTTHAVLSSGHQQQRSDGASLVMNGNCFSPDAGDAKPSPTAISVSAMKPCQYLRCASSRTARCRSGPGTPRPQ